MARFLTLAAAYLITANTASAVTYPTVAELNKYLLIGTGSNDNHKGINVQNGDLGADIYVLSDEMNDNVDFNLVRTHDRWISHCHTCTCTYLSTFSCVLIP